MILDVKIPPPVIAIITVLLMYLSTHFIPILRLDFVNKPILIIIFSALGLLIDIISIITFWRHKTTIDPRYPDKSKNLVNVGIYQLSRNPMYIGLCFLLLGAACYFASLSGFLMIPLCIYYLTQFQIKPEEKVLKRLFGQEYIDYTNRVRRWL